MSDIALMEVLGISVSILGSRTLALESTTANLG